MKSVTGHSMGGHGSATHSPPHPCPLPSSSPPSLTSPSCLCTLLSALICFLKSPPSTYASVSAFAPIAHPSECQWGIKAFTGYLGSDRSRWAEWDATELLPQYKGPATSILVDQGSGDEWLKKGQLRPDDLVEAARKAGGRVSVELRMQEEYEHSYYFIQTFIGEHIERHAKALHAA